VGKIEARNVRGGPIDRLKQLQPRARVIMISRITSFQKKARSSIAPSPPPPSPPSSRPQRKRATILPPVPTCLLIVAVAAVVARSPPATCSVHVEATDPTTRTAFVVVPPPPRCLQQRNPTIAAPVFSRHLDSSALSSTSLSAKGGGGASAGAVQEGEEESRGGSTVAVAGTGTVVGLYRPIAEMVWDRLLLLDGKKDWKLEDCGIPDELRSNVAPSKGVDEYVVRMETRALRGTGACDRDGGDSSGSGSSPLSYARMALLETLPVAASSASDGSESTRASGEHDDNIETTVTTSGIQVLNLVLFPPGHTTLPVWGADFVSLPGDKHLLLLDAQPMNGDRSHERRWSRWYDTHGVSHQFEWGGDLPEKVRPYVSRYALWTRMGGGFSSSTTGNDDLDGDDESGRRRGQQRPALHRIRGPLVSAVLDHLAIYLKLVEEEAGGASGDRSAAVDNQADYVRYRLENDPARPMLRSLFGEEWTEQVLERVLFPQVE